MARPKKVEKYGLAALHDVPVLAAADIALALLKYTHQPSMAVLAEKANADDALVTELITPIIFTDAQVQLLEDHLSDLQLLRFGTPSVNLTWCPSCQKVAAASGTVPTRCQLTDNCPGKPVKSGTAKKAPAV